MRIAFLDHVYPEAWNSLPHSTMEEWFHQSFGTSNFWEIALTKAGHVAATFVLNQYRLGLLDMLEDAAAFLPDIVCSMEVGRFSSPVLRARFPNAKLVAFCSHRADLNAIMGFDVVFSSFNWMPDYCKSIGVRCEYLPLAFGRPVLDRIGEMPAERDIDVAFIGGLGAPTWTKATSDMAIIAEQVPAFQWWGYACGNRFSELPPSLRESYSGSAWGLDMYRLLSRTKICVNRHGEIARGFGQNCRQYESIGMGCYLLTDDIGEMSEGCQYRDAENAVTAIEILLEEWDQLTKSNAECGQRWVLEKQCYENLTPRFLEVVNSL